jgi:hypothetical protein
MPYSVIATTLYADSGRLIPFNWRRIYDKCFVVVGLGCLAAVLLTHIAERFQIFPGMGWGLPNGPGHYLDLASAVLGFTFLSLGLVGRRLGATAQCRRSPHHVDVHGRRSPRQNGPRLPKPSGNLKSSSKSQNHCAEGLA